MASYWLFKTEPQEFSIDDLASVSREAWSGVRNYQARNFLRDDVSVGDAVFIYHSSCKHIGIAGIAEVVKAAYPDPFQFDSNSVYFDVKSSREDPRWYCVDVQFVKKFAQLIPLSLLKRQATLEHMQLLCRPRLSIQVVCPSEWQHIISLSDAAK